MINKRIDFKNKYLKLIRGALLTGAMLLATPSFANGNIQNLFENVSSPSSKTQIDTSNSQDNAFDMIVYSNAKNIHNGLSKQAIALMGEFQNGNDGLTRYAKI